MKSSTRSSKPFPDAMDAAGKEIRLQITGFGSEMQGIGRMEDGRCVFVPGALPGETVDVAITRDNKRYLLSRLIHIIEKSPDRAKPMCPYYEKCGGCAAQHMTYEASLRAKTQRVKDAIERIGGIASPMVYPIIGCDSPFRGRRKAEYLVSGKKIGCAMEKSREIIEIEDCLLQNEGSILVMRSVRKWLQSHESDGLRFVVTRVNGAGELSVTLSSEKNARFSSLADTIMNEVPAVKSVHMCRLNGKPNHALDGEVARITGVRTIEDSISGVFFMLSPQSFFQVNPPQAEKLFAEAIKAAELSGHEAMIDAYCGAGAISLLFAKHVGHVYGVEIVPQAIDDALVNAKNNGLADKCTFIAGDMKDVFPALLKKGVKPSLMTIDPPRKGMDPSVVETVKKCLPEKIVYISCDPGTLARDIKLLCADGLYRFVYAQPVDMFSWTEHVETVVLLCKK